MNVKGCFGASLVLIGLGYAADVPGYAADVLAHEEPFEPIDQSQPIAVPPPASPLPDLGTGPSHYVAPGGSGVTCAQSDPCGSIDAAYQVAQPGDVIQLAAGSYGAQSIAYRSAADSWTANVVVRPSAGASVTLGDVTIQSPRLTLQNVSVGEVTLCCASESAKYTRLERIKASGEVHIMGTDRTAVVDSTLQPTGLNMVALAVTPYNPGERPPDDTLIENNKIGPTWASPDWKALEVHNESVHVLGASNLTIRGNLILEGGTSTTLSIDDSLGANTNVLVENNYLLGCGVRTPPSGAVCAAYYALTTQNNQGRPSSDIVVRNNTVRGGFIDYGFYSRNTPTSQVSGSVIDANGLCSGPAMSGNLVGPGSWGDCNQNAKGTPIYSNPTFEGLNLGMAAGSPGAGYGVPAGAGYVSTP